MQNEKKVNHAYEDLSWFEDFTGADDTSLGHKRAQTIFPGDVEKVLRHHFQFFSTFTII